LPRPPLEVADIFRRHGPAWRRANAGHVSLGQLRVMSAIESCRTAALGGHVARCEACAQIEIAYNSCRNRHCPKCQAAAAKEWLGERQAELLPVSYYHVVFTLPAPIGDLAYHNKAVVYDHPRAPPGAPWPTVISPRRLGRPSAPPLPQPTTRARQIPIDPSRGTAGPVRPAVRSPEACRTPAARATGTAPARQTSDNP
jgi:hypothetical protein